MYSVHNNHRSGWVSPFGNSRVKASLTARRDLSQSTTSFIASYRLGIHHVRLVAWPYNLKQPVYGLIFLPIAALCSSQTSVAYFFVCYSSAQPTPKSQQKSPYPKLLSQLPALNKGPTPRLHDDQTSFTWFSCTNAYLNWNWFNSRR